jgi:tRNA nucleotidyltransferase (CCA-adding enzyme)
MKMFGLTPGKAVGAVLEHLLECVLDNPEDNTRDTLESMARAFYQSYISNSKYNKDEEASQ